MRASEFDFPMFYHGTETKFDSFNSKSGAYWFTDNLDSAKSQGPYVIAAQLTLKNPYRWKEGDPEPDNPSFRRGLIAHGHDGVIAPSNVGVNDDYIVFDPSQIKILGRKEFRDNEQLSSGS